jgi:hypothetical protein
VGHRFAAYDANLANGHRMNRLPRRNDIMTNSDSVIAVFADHTSAETAVKELNTSGFDIKHLSVVGKGYHTDEKVVGFYNSGDRVKFWGSRGAFWGGLWGLFFGGLFLSIPIIGHVVVLGYLAATVISGVEGAVVVGGLSAIGAALYGMNIPKDSVLNYETAVAADNFLVMVHGTPAEMTRAQSILGTTGATSVAVYEGTKELQAAQ